MICPHCGSENLRARGTRDGWQRFSCNTCGKWSKETRTYEKQDVPLIPDGERIDYSPLVLDSLAYPILVGADAHVPYHDRRAIETFINRGISIKPKTIILKGDWLDCYQLSKFLRDPKQRSVVEEIAILNGILRVLRLTFPDARIIYKFGNHEERYAHYLMRCAPELFGLKSIQLAELPELGLAELGIEVVQDRRIIKAGHLHLIHGNEYTGGITAPVNPARSLYLKAKKSAMEGHFHQTSEHTETAINDDVVTCWSIGCLCDLHPQYMPLNKWNHGFAEIMEEDGFFVVRNRLIINGRLL
jgi:predicted phosphodiesterase